MKNIILLFLMLNSIHSHANNSEKILSYVGFGATAFMIYGLINRTKYKNPEKLTYGIEDDMVISRIGMKKTIKRQMGFQASLASIMGILAYKLYKKSI